jgi:hypothetical protein
MHTTIHKIDTTKGEVTEESSEVLPNPKSLVPKALQKINVLFIGHVEEGYFHPAPDKLNNPPRWEQGAYNITTGKWPSPELTSNFIDLSEYNGDAIMVMASAWDTEVISQARIFGKLSQMACDVIVTFAYDKLQASEEEIAAFISGISN